MLPGMLRVPKITRNCLLDYLDFWYVHRPPSHLNKLLMSITNDYFYLENEGRERKSSNIVLLLELK